MKPKRGTYLCVIRWFILVVTLLVGTLAYPNASWSRPAVQILKGDPDDPEAPTPSPTKTVTTLAPSAPLDPDSSFKNGQVLNSTRHDWAFLITYILRLRF